MNFINGNNKNIYHPTWINNWFGVNLGSNGGYPVFTPYNIIYMPLPLWGDSFHYLGSFHINERESLAPSFILPLPSKVKVVNNVIYNAMFIWMYNIFTNNNYGEYLINTNEIKSITYYNKQYNETNPYPSIETKQPARIDEGIIKTFQKRLTS